MCVHSQAFSENIKFVEIASFLAGSLMSLECENIIFHFYFFLYFKYTSRFPYLNHTNLFCVILLVSIFVFFVKIYFDHFMNKIYFIKKVKHFFEYFFFISFCQYFCTRLQHWQYCFKNTKINIFLNILMQKMLYNNKYFQFWNFGKKQESRWQIV